MAQSALRAACLIAILPACQREQDSGSPGARSTRVEDDSTSRPSSRESGSAGASGADHVADRERSTSSSPTQPAAVGAPLVWEEGGSLRIAAGQLDRYFDAHDGENGIERSLRYLSCVYIEHGDPEGLLLTDDWRLAAWSGYSSTPQLAGSLGLLDRVAFTIMLAIAEAAGRQESSVVSRVTGGRVAAHLRVVERRAWRRGAVVSGIAYDTERPGSFARAVLFCLEGLARSRVSLD